MPPSTKAIFLDRDGTIIVDKVYLNDPDQIEFLPNAFEGLKIFKDLGYRFFVATNQSGVPRGKVTLENLNEIHRRIQVACKEHGVEIEKFYYAPFMTDSGHHMRKPNPGMLEEGAKDFNIDLSQSWMIGDKMIDVEAGHRAGARSILLTSHGEDPSLSEFAPPEFIANDLLECAVFVKNHM